MAYDFPNAPTVGQVYSGFVWDGEKWVAQGGPMGAVRYDLAQGLTSAQQDQGRSNIVAAPFDAMAYTGLQVNGSMEVSQEFGGTATAHVTGAFKYTLDQWQVYWSAAGASIGVQQTPIATLPGFRSAVGVYANPAVTTSAAADLVILQQQIEGVRWARLGWGTAGARPITISFWVHSANIPGTISVGIKNKTGPSTRSYVVPVTINAAALWEFKTVTIPGETTGGASAWPNDNTVAASLVFTFHAGATWVGAGNTWLAGNNYAATGQTNLMIASNVVYITGVNVVMGSQGPTAAQSFNIVRPYDQELMTCRRYLWRRNFPIVGTVIGTIQSFGPTLASGMLFSFPQEMRIAPAVTIANVGYFGAYNTGGGGIITAVSLAFQSTTDQVALGTSTFNTGLTTGAAAAFISNNAASWMQMDARLP